MISRLKNYIQDHKMFDQHHKLLIGVSGGVDSMVLLHLLRDAGYSLTVGHMNFKLRGEDSDEDEKLVVSICDDLGMPYFSTQVDTAAYATEKGISIQMAARDLRYDWFTNLMVNHKLDFLVTAHHADDLIETALFNLTKGTGLSGLRAIQPVAGIKRRPLLFAPKEDIQAYARENQVHWREDVSNGSSKYARNKIRIEVLPRLKEINPSVTENFNYTHSRLIGAEALVWKVVNEITSKYLRTDVSGIHLDLVWVEDNEASEVIMSEVLKPYQFSFRQSQQIVKAALTEGGKDFISENYQVQIDRETLRIVALEIAVSATSFVVEEDTNYVDVNNIRWSFRKVNTSTFMKSESGDTLFLDLDMIKFPLVLRNWKEGDSFSPLGMKGKRKKISDFLIDEKVPLWLKRESLVLTSDDEICCVMGQRPDDRFKMTNTTSTLLQIHRLDLRV